MLEVVRSPRGLSLILSPLQPPHLLHQYQHFYKLNITLQTFNLNFQQLLTASRILNSQKLSEKLRDIELEYFIFTVQLLLLPSQTKTNFLSKYFPVHKPLMTKWFGRVKYSLYKTRNTRINYFSFFSSSILFLYHFILNSRSANCCWNPSLI